MDSCRRLTANCVGTALLVSLLIISPARAHVILDDPNGGEQLEVGSCFTVSWHIQSSHKLQNWDLWYSTTGSNGPWIVIAMNLPPGSGAQGSVHTYDWLIPDAVSDQVRVRVRMDNYLEQDYEDISNGNLSIVVTASCPWDLDGNRSVGTSDLLSLLAQWGPDACGPPDFDGNGTVSTSDLLALLANWGPCP